VIYVDRVVDNYLSSGDYNGLYYSKSSIADETEVIRAIETGDVEVVDENDFINPHIRPWSPMRSAADQVQIVRASAQSDQGFCIYPTAQSMASYVLPADFAGKLFSEVMARGSGTLELSFFTFDVLESYRNDPRFDFEFEDFGVSTTSRTRTMRSLAPRTQTASSCVTSATPTTSLT
jgi:hypothetical protein